MVSTVILPKPGEPGQRRVAAKTSCGIFFLSGGPLYQMLRKLHVCALHERIEPDLQLLFGPAYYVNHGLTPRAEHCLVSGYSDSAGSRGEISLRSANTLGPLLFAANYLSTEKSRHADHRPRSPASRQPRTQRRSNLLGRNCIPRESEERRRHSDFVRKRSRDALPSVVATCKMGNDSRRWWMRGASSRNRKNAGVDASVMPADHAAIQNAPQYDRRESCRHDSGKMPNGQVQHLQDCTLFISAILFACEIRFRLQALLLVAALPP